MELRQLEYFVAVAETANFTRAAERVHISQPGISAQIRALESELGLPLLDRTGRVTTVTQAGAAVLEHARAALASASAIRRSVDELAGLVRGRLVVGLVYASTLPALFDAIAKLHEGYPGVEISLVEANSDQLIDGVRTGTVDLALVGTAARPPDGLPTLPVISEPVVAAVPDGHPLARRRRVSLATVCAGPVVCLPTGTGVRAVFDQACAERAISPDIAFEASAPAAVADLAVRGLGTAILSTSIAAEFAGRLNVLGLDVRTPALLSVIWSATGSPALTELVRVFRQSLATR